MINVALVDDQELIREGIARLVELDEDLKLVWQAQNGQDAIDNLTLDKDNKLLPDIIISDIRMPVMNGIEFVEELRRQGSILPVLILTTFDEHELFMRALNAGANGFLLKDIDFEKLSASIKKVAAGGFLAEPALLNRQLLPTDTNSTLSIGMSADDFSEKERQILRYLAAGFSNKEIAQAIHLANGTVKNHISNLLSKLDCRDRTQAVLKALQWRLI